MNLRSRVAAPEMREALLAFCFFLAIAFIFTAPLSLSPASQAVNEGDPLIISWTLAWVAHQLTTNPFRLFDSNAFYPYPTSLAFSEHLTVEALMVGPIYLVSGNALLAQNIAVLLALALSGWAMFLLLREMIGHRDAALIGGMLYAFHSYTLHEVPRVQVLSIQWWPLAILFLYRAFRSGLWKDAALFGLFFLLQGLSSTYSLIYFSMMLLLWIPGVFLWAKRSHAVREVGKVGGALVAAGSVLVLFALPYLKMFPAFGYQRSLAKGLDLLDYVTPPEGTPFSFWIDKPSATHHFIGFGALFLVLLGLIAGVSRAKESPGGRECTPFSTTTCLFSAACAHRSASQFS